MREAAINQLPLEAVGHAKNRIMGTLVAADFGVRQQTVVQGGKRPLLVEAWLPGLHLPVRNLLHRRANVFVRQRGRETGGQRARIDGRIPCRSQFDRTGVCRALRDGRRGEQKQHRKQKSLRHGAS